jgi:RNA polymerase sigma-70 factor (ECF subfamily)
LYCKINLAEYKLGEDTISSFEQNTNKKSKSILSGELALKITQGDANASNEFVQINYRWLLFIIRRKFSQSNNHEDIVQDTFMLVITKLQQGSINNPQTILAFLRTTAINIGFEYLRKDKKFISALDQELLNVIEDAKEDILSSIIWNDKVKYVRQVISELKIQRDKDILIKFYFNDLDKKFICTELDLSSEHFDRVLYRAKARLKQLIAHKGDNNPNNTHSAKKNHKTAKSTTFMSKIIELFNSPNWVLLFNKINAPRRKISGKSLGEIA